jgi:hypothetical protein
MSGTITRIGVTGAGALLAIGLLATPSAAKGGDKDDKGHRTLAACFTADGHTQGRSQSDPDGMENGGFDKPGCDGGINDDKDGNNGCGNDTDREDDNNGRCGRAPDGPAAEADADEVKDEAETPAGATVAGSVVTAADAGATVAGSTVEAGTTTADAGATTPAAVEGTTATDDDGTKVLGVTLTRPDAALPRTGAGVGGLALLGGLLCGGGRVAILARRFLRS